MEFKRKFYLDQSSKDKTKKVRDDDDQSITSIEHFSNEFFYEIFDYLDACDIYNAFSNLNHRFEQLLNSPFLLFKIQLIDSSVSDEICFQKWMQMVYLNRQQILSIHLLMSLHFNHLLSFLFINSSFHRLESLILLAPEPDTLMFILEELNCLPRLFSLTIKNLYSLHDLTDVYRLVLALPVLKYYKISTLNSNLSISLPMATNQQSNTLEYLVIDHCCTFTELSKIISYTPQLRHLSFMESYEVPATIRTTIFPFILTNLISLRICVCHVNFEEFQIFLRQFCPKLKVLSMIIRREDVAYLNAHEWEQFILQYLSELEKFSLKYYQYIDDDDEHEWNINFGGSNPFMTSFWIQRGWFLDTEIEGENIVYSVRSYRKRWYELQNIINSSDQLSQSTRLILSLNIPSDELYELIMHIKNILNLTQIYHLEISDEKIFVDLLMQITSSLPKLNSIRIHSLSLNQRRDLETEELISFPSTKSSNRMTKVYLEKIFDIEEVYSLIKLYPSMSYLKVNSFDNMNVQMFVRYILKKIHHDANPYLRLLSFPVPLVHDHQLIKTLEKMIKNENLLTDYTIRRVDGEICLQWK